MRKHPRRERWGDLPQDMYLTITHSAPPPWMPLKQALRSWAGAPGAQAGASEYLKPQDKLSVSL